MLQSKLFENIYKYKILYFIVLFIIFSFGSNLPVTYGKVKLPGEVEVTIDENSAPDKPININILAISKIPFKNGIVELIIPGFGNQRPQQIKLWSGHADSPIKKHLNYSILLPFPGKYKVNAYFRFTPLREGAAQVTVVKSLYLDINKEAVSSTNIPSKAAKQAQLKLESTKKATFITTPTAKESVTPDNQKKSTVLIKKAPLQGYKDVARKTTGEINREKLETTVKQSEYKGSEQAKAKRKAKEKKEK